MKDAEGRLYELGFKEDAFGQYIATDCRVNVYRFGGEYEVDITLPNDSAIGFDVPINKLASKTAAEREHARRDDRQAYIDETDDGDAPF